MYASGKVLIGTVYGGGGGDKEKLGGGHSKISLATLDRR